MIPNPKSQIAIEIHYAALDNVLETYPDIDYVWLWLNEHSFMGVNIEKALENASFAEAYNVGQGYFKEAADSAAQRGPQRGSPFLAWFHGDLGTAP